MKILLVEDNSADAMLLMELVSEKTKLLEIKWVTDGSEALDYIAKDLKQDLVLLDLSLPRISGYDVLKNIKSGLATREIPVIVLSTSANPKDVTECRNLGAEGFLSKPSDLEGYEVLTAQMANAKQAQAMPGMF